MSSSEAEEDNFQSNIVIIVIYIFGIQCLFHHFDSRRSGNWQTNKKEQQIETRRCDVSVTGSRHSMSRCRLAISLRAVAMTKGRTVADLKKEDTVEFLPGPDSTRHHATGNDGCPNRTSKQQKLTYPMFGSI